jgi:protein-tyrosine-phosphatase
MLTMLAAACPFLALLALTDGNHSLMPALQDYVNQRTGEFDEIPLARKEQLQQVADFVREHIQAGKPARLTFICTHNSRRSHLSQIWAQTAAAYYGHSGVETYSGGVEVTAFNPRAVAALKRAGFSVPDPGEGANPHYKVAFARDVDPLDCFSKVYDQPPNPGSDFCAVMVCGEADKNCPMVEGAALRLAVSYDDPRAFDGTPQEADKYDESCRQIAREMLYLFSRVNALPLGIDQQAH